MAEFFHSFRGFRGGGWFDKLTIITLQHVQGAALSLSKGHPHPVRAR